MDWNEVDWVGNIVKYIDDNTAVAYDDYDERRRGEQWKWMRDLT